MEDFTYSINKAIDKINLITKNLDKAVIFGLNYYIEKLLIRHFQYSQQKDYNYTPLNYKYAERKLKKVGVQPILVYSGKLKNDTINSAKVIKTSSGYIISFYIPDYGKYQINDYGRDFISPSNRDIRDLLRVVSNNFVKSMNK